MSFKVHKKGETLIEVVLSFAILAVVLTASYILTNRASRITQAASERTEAANLIRAQAEILKALATADRIATPDVDPTQPWDNLVQNIAALESNLPGGVTSSCDVSGGVTTRNNDTSLTTPRAFWFDPSGQYQELSAAGDTPQVYNAGLPYSIWIEAVRTTSGGLTNPKDEYVDFHVFACWQRLGNGVVESTGLVERINL